MSEKLMNEINRPLRQMDPRIKTMNAQVDSYLDCNWITAEVL